MDGKTALKKFDYWNKRFMGYFPFAVGVLFLGAIQWAQASGCSITLDATKSLETVVGFAVMFALSARFGKTDFKKDE